MSLVNSPKVEYEVSVRDGNDPSAPTLRRPLSVGDRVVSKEYFIYSLECLS
ncbi:unnamed protein product [Cylicostephanus goldi]|uniref:Uncharacterized protein n=1 Tax=Cylicostephanus goldi TaxID=71465 RepID=A0A3P7MKE6_CYLGO|nr:unnamed protein product [Cylicostephanus goldi]